jgi:peroxiredoxin Q/BCP
MLETSRRLALLALSFGLLTASCRTAQPRPDGGTGLLPVGSTAPDVVGFDAEGKETKLSSLRGHPAVVYFYPKDGTPGCTKEACAFRDQWLRYREANVGIIGVSTDSREKHATFQKEHKLPFPLASDESGDVGKAYGVSKGLFGYSRVSFLVGADGKIVKVWPDVDPGIHADEVLAVAAPNAAR